MFFYTQKVFNLLRDYAYVFFLIYVLAIENLAKYESLVTEITIGQVVRSFLFEVFLGWRTKSSLLVVTALCIR